MIKNHIKKKMIVSIHQPDYIPYIGYFYKIYKSDIFVFLDDAQFSNDNMHHWNRIKTPQGECRLKIPVDYEFGDSITEVRTKDELKWKEKHLKTIEMNYKKAKYFDDFFPSFKEILMSDYSSLAEQNIALNKFICNKIGIKTIFKRSSEMEITSRKEERVIDICADFNADEYISGNGAKAYQKDEDFSNRGVKLTYTKYQPFEYQQLWKEFIPNLSVIDYIMNMGYDWEKVVNEIEKSEN